MTGTEPDPVGGVLPAPTPLTRPFWEAAARGRLVIQQCADCGQMQWTPQFACRSCLGEQLGWLECSGRAVVYSATVVHRSPDPRLWPAPYVVAVVTLDEGPRMLTRITGADPRAVTIGMPVTVVFRTLDDVHTVYEFRPA